MGRFERNDRNIVIMGGGTGAPNVAKGLKGMGNLTALVTTFDDGGSSQILRFTPGVPAVGDARRFLGAMANNQEMAAYYEWKRADGHPNGNIALYEATLDMEGRFDLAVQAVAGQLAVRGQVWPIAANSVADLVMRDGDHRIFGESAIGRFRASRSAYVELSPEVDIHPEADRAIREADMVIIGPGSLHTSLGAVLAPWGVMEALDDTSATLVNVANLQQEPNTPAGQHVVDNVLALEAYTGRPFDYVIYNTAISPGWGAAALGIEPGRFNEISGTAIDAPLAASNGHVLHDPHTVAVQIKQLLA